MADKIDNHKVLEKLEIISDRLVDIFILLATDSGANKKEVRKVLGIGMNRVTDVSRLINKKEGKKNEKQQA